MLEMTGRNDFSGRFDFFKWEAPIYQNPVELLTAAESFGLTGKTVKGVFTIGYAHDVGGTDSGLLQGRLWQAGVDGKGTWENRDNDLNNVRLPCRADLFEPVQIVFTDGTTLEVLPMDRGCGRITRNGVPAGLTCGINRSNLNAEGLLGEELIGRKFKGLSVRVCRETETFYGREFNRSEKPPERVHTKYQYRLEFSDAYSLELVVGERFGGYRLQLIAYDVVVQLPYGRIRAAKTEVEQITMIPGYITGGTMRIMPAKWKEDHHEQPKDLQGDLTLFIDDDQCWELLATVLVHYFDPTVQIPDADGSEAFDRYGINRYSFDTVKQMLVQVRKIARLLVEDYDAPELEQIKARYSVYSFDSKALGSHLSKEEQAALIKRNIHIAVAFYERFADRIESIMAHCPDCDIMVFSGP